MESVNAHSQMEILQVTKVNRAPHGGLVAQEDHELRQVVVLLDEIREEPVPLLL